MVRWLDWFGWFLTFEGSFFATWNVNLSVQFNGTFSSVKEQNNTYKEFCFFLPLCWLGQEFSLSYAQLSWAEFCHRGSTCSRCHPLQICDFALPSKSLRGKKSCHLGTRPSRGASNSLRRLRALPAPSGVLETRIKQLVTRCFDMTLQQRWPV